MKGKLISSAGDKTYAVIFDTGDEVVKGLTDFAREQRLSGSHLTAIGAFQDVTLGYFDWQTKEYRKIPLHEQVEVLSLVGDVALAPDGSPKLHAHVVVGRGRSRRPGQGVARAFVLRHHLRASA